MNKIIWIIAVSLVVGSPSLASVLTVRIADTNGIAQLSLMSKNVTREKMKTVLGKVAALDKDQLVYVIVDDKVSAATLVQVLHDIQSTGLYGLVLMSPAKEDGKDGMYQITVDATKRRFGGCIAGVEFDSGFNESPEYSLRHVNKALETLDKGKTNSQH